ncbi:MAG: hypothetical protein AAF335_02735 [Bacteroidota bacterium]
MKTFLVTHKKIFLISLLSLLLLYSIIPSRTNDPKKPLKGFFVAERTEAIKTMQASQKVAHEVEETLQTTRQTMKVLMKETQQQITELKQMIKKYKSYPIKLITAWTYVAYAMTLACCVIALYYGAHAYTIIPTSN